MGLKDKIKGGLRSVWSPITVWMADEGSDQLVTAGGQAKVVVAVKGEDDGTADRIDVELVLAGSGMTESRTWPLGQVPTPLGSHEIEVIIPTDLPPSCAQYAEYSFRATLHRIKGMGSSASSVVDVVARAEDLYWPAGPRSGTEAEQGTWLHVTLDSDHVTAGSTVTGRATTAGTEQVTVVIGALVVAPPATKAKFKEVDRVKVDAGAAFSLTIPEGVPPTLLNGAASVCWQVRATLDKTTSWQWVGVLDPTGSAGIRNRPSPGLLYWLDSFDSTPGYN